MWEIHISQTELYLYLSSCKKKLKIYWLRVFLNVAFAFHRETDGFFLDVEKTVVDEHQLGV
jgi:hypothetical protein